MLLTNWLSNEKTQFDMSKQQYTCNQYNVLHQTVLSLKQHFLVLIY